jgi:hypothetical protein
MSIFKNKVLPFTVKEEEEAKIPGEDSGSDID